MKERKTCAVISLRDGYRTSLESKSFIIVCIMGRKSASPGISPSIPKFDIICIISSSLMLSSCLVNNSIRASQTTDTHLQFVHDTIQNSLASKCSSDLLLLIVIIFTKDSNINHDINKELRTEQ